MSEESAFGLTFASVVTLAFICTLRNERKTVGEAVIVSLMCGWFFTMALLLARAPEYLLRRKPATTDPQDSLVHVTSLRPSGMVAHAIKATYYRRGNPNPSSFVVRDQQTGQLIFPECLVVHADTDDLHEMLVYYQDENGPRPWTIPGFKHGNETIFVFPQRLQDELHDGHSFPAIDILSNGIHYPMTALSGGDHVLAPK